VTSSTKFRLRIVTQNLWHGLDHTRPTLMLPAENPVKAWLRRKAIVRGLQKLRAADNPLLGHDWNTLEITCLQEVNPLRRRLDTLRQELGMQGVGVAVNTGIRVGDLSYPPFLQEGLATLWRGDFTETSSDHRFLSGGGVDFTGPLGVPVSAHLSERRAALGVAGTWAGKRWLFVNVHLHSGAAKLGHDLRRRDEVEKLLEWMEPWRQKVDAIVLCGDFNADGDHPEIRTLKQTGFQDLQPPTEGPLLTWQPAKNPTCAASVALNTDPNMLAWDEASHQFDHVFVWSKGMEPWTSRIQLAFDMPVGLTWVSDHFGLVADLIWTQDSHTP